MLLVPRKRIWTQQPSCPVIDMSHPLARAVSFVWIGDGGRNLVTDAMFAKTGVNGDAVPAITSSGRALTFSGATSFNSAGDVFGNSDVTAMFRGSPQNSSSIALAIKQSGSLGSVWFGANTNELGTGVAGQLCLALLRNSVNRSAVKVPGVIDGTMSTYLVGKKAGAGIAYKNGVKLSASLVSTLNAAPTTSADVVKVGGDSENSAQSFGDDLVLAVVWKRLLTDPEAASVSANPWQLFKAPERRIFVPVSAGASGGSALTASPSSGVSRVSQITVGQRQQLTVSASTATQYAGSVQLGQGAAPLQLSFLASTQLVYASPVSLRQGQPVSLLGSKQVNRASSVSLAQSHSVVAASSQQAIHAGTVALDILILGVLAALPGRLVSHAASGDIRQTHGLSIAPSRQPGKASALALDASVRLGIWRIEGSMHGDYWEGVSQLPEAVWLIKERPLS